MMKSDTIDPLNVDFSHRFSTCGVLDKADYLDSISLATGRAIGVLHSIALQFESDNCSQLSNTLIHYALFSAINDIRDIDAITCALARADFTPANPEVAP